MAPTDLVSDDVRCHPVVRARNGRHPVRDASDPSSGAPLCDDDDRGVAASFVTALDSVTDLVDVERELRDQHNGRATGDPRVRRDPSTVTTHHLDDHHPVVALGGRVESVDGVSGDLHRGVEPECLLVP